MNEEERVQIRDARKHCFFIVDNVIIDHYASIIGPFPTLVYSALCRHADYSTRETFPSLSTIAKELGISRMTVIRAIQCLVTHGLIARKSRKSKSGDPDTNIYIILEPWGSHSQRLPQKTEMLRQGYTSNEVVTESDQVVTESDQVVTESDQGSHSQRLGVVTEVDPNNTQLEQDSSNKKEDSPRPPRSKSLKRRTSTTAIRSLVNSGLSRSPVPLGAKASSRNPSATGNSITSKSTLSWPSR